MALPAGLRLLKLVAGSRPESLPLANGVTELPGLAELLVEAAAGQEVTVTWLGAEADAPAVQRKGGSEQAALATGRVPRGSEATARLLQC